MAADRLGREHERDGNEPGKVEMMRAGPVKGQTVVPGVEPQMAYTMRAQRQIDRRCRGANDPEGKQPTARPVMSFARSLRPTFRTSDRRFCP